MLKFLRPWALVGALCAALSGTAGAATVTFEDVTPGLGSIYSSGDSFTSGSFRFDVTSMFLPPVPDGLVGQVGDDSSVFFVAPPTNSTGQYYQGYNDGGVTMVSNIVDKAFLRLDGFSFAFLPFVPGLYSADDVPGALLVSYVTDGGATGVESFDFAPSDDDGLFAFSTVSGAQLGALQGLTLRSVTFYACTRSDLTDPTSCTNPSAFNDAWFALDNIVAVNIPEPISAALLLIGLAAAGTARRRARA
jgi:hypothetical protein